jgi:hypothetical protein
MADVAERLKTNRRTALLLVRRSDMRVVQGPRRSVLVPVSEFERAMAAQLVPAHRTGAA